MSSEIKIVGIKNVGGMGVRITKEMGLKLFNYDGYLSLTLLEILDDIEKKHGIKYITYSEPGAYIGNDRYAFVIDAKTLLGCLEKGYDFMNPLKLLGLDIEMDDLEIITETHYS